MTTPSSLVEQQLRYMAAQHLMTVRPTQWRDASSVPTAQHTQQHLKIEHHAGAAVTGEDHGTRKRGRRKARKTTGAGDHDAKRMTAPLLYAPVDAQPVKIPRKSKSAYELQKEQRSELADHARELEEQVERLRRAAGLPTKADRQKIADSRRCSAELDESIHATRQYAVRLQSLIKEQLQKPVVNPLSTFIHLPCDQAQRRAILLGMKDVKLRRAAEAGIEHFHHLEGYTSYLREERFTTDDSAFHCNRWEITTFPHFRTARQLYDALLFWIYNMEISVTEMVNQIALREDDQDIEPTIWNHRIITTTEDVGCTEELNLVGFAQFYDRHDAAQGPLGVITYSSVDVDDLYPYKPLERTRKEVQAYHLFCEVIDAETQRKSIVLKTCLLNAQLAPQFPVEQRVIDKLHEYMSRWIVLMSQYLSEYTVPP